MGLRDLRAELSQLDVIDQGPLLQQLSHDQFSFSPSLVPRLQPCCADLVVRVSSTAEVVQVAGACARHGVPLTPRGAGTGNYGQAVPLEGGVVLDTSAMQQVRQFDPLSGVLTAEPGCRLLELDRYLQPQGWALRLAPSTWRTASLGGFIAGGSSGVGSVRWGLLRDPGNLLGLEVVTVEPEPRVLQLDAAAARGLNHAYGSNGIFTAITVPTAPWQDWQEVALVAESAAAALALGEQLTAAALEIDGLCFLERRLLERMPALGSSPWPSGDALLLLAAPAALPLIETMATAAGAKLCWQRPQWPPRGLLLRELCWNHTTLQVRANAPEFTYQLVLLPDPVGPFIEAIAERWPGWVHWHLERVRQGGRLRWVGLLPFQWRGETALAELNGALKAAGGLVFNAHAITVEDGGLGVVDADQVAAKRAYDPAGLCNPGKLRGWSSGAVEA